jgi:epsilon-lactone hydrolase
MASPQFHKFLDLVERNRPSSDAVDVAAMRRNLDRIGGKLPADVTAIPDVVGGVEGEWILPASADQSAAMLYLHGGGYVAGSVDSHRNLLGHLAKAIGCRLFAANYQLAPEYPHPAPVRDATAAYRGMVDQGISPSRLAIAGDSAGGGLTVATLVNLRDEGDRLPAAAAVISPWIDLEATGESATTRAAVDPMITPGSLREIARLFIGDDGNPRDPLAAPLHADMTGLPPMLIQVGDAEVLLDDANRLAAKITESGGQAELEVWPEMIHVWHGSAGFVPESDQAIERIAAFVRPLICLC